MALLANCVAPFAYSRMAEALTGDRDEVEPEPGFLHAIEPEMVVGIVTYVASRSCSLTHRTFSAAAGRFARIFVGLADGWLAADSSIPTAEDIDANLAEVIATETYRIPESIYDEVTQLCERLGIAGG